MDLFQWDEILEIGDPEIDAQHKGLFQVANCLHQAIIEGKGKDVSEEIGGSLHRDALHHFGLEEKLMRLQGYPGLEEHATEHRQFGVLLAGLTTGGQKVTPFQTIQLLHAMIRGHILEVDLPMIRWIRSRKGVLSLDSVRPSALNPAEDW